MIPLSLEEGCRIYLEFSKDNLIPLINQILKSEELIEETNKISIKDTKNIKKDIEKILNEIIKKELKYYLTKYKIKTIQQFISLFEKLSIEEIAKVRRKITKEVVMKSIGQDE